MQDWEYNELIECINETFNDYKDKGYSNLDAGSYTIEDYWYNKEDQNVIENLIIITNILKILLEDNNRVFIGTIDLFEKILSIVSFESIKNVLTEDEMKNLECDIRIVKSLIENANIEYNSESK